MILYGIIDTWITNTMRRQMASILLRRSFCNGVALCARESITQYRHQIPMQMYRFRGIATPTRYLLRDKLNDFASFLRDAASGLLGSYLPGVERPLKRLLLKLPNATATFPPLEHYVPRASYESKILSVYHTRLESGYDSYTIVAGPKGAGKSSTVEQCLNNKPGVIFLYITQADGVKTILDRLLGTSYQNVEGAKPELEILSPAFLDAAKKSDGRRITVVLEVERGSQSDEKLYMVKTSAKKLARFANVIVILSEANAALMFGDDVRQKFIWFDGMTNDQAMEFAKKLFPTICDDDLKLLIDKVGMHPSEYPSQRNQ